MIPYHEATKHTAERLRTLPHTLDWANMPEPFRRHEGARLVDMEAEAKEFISKLFFYSAAISASKVSPGGMRYALRVNPSSGNLHPTEFHFATRGVAGWEDGIYHYRADGHMAELRARGTPPFEAPLTVLLSTIAWREAWKYGERAYRYCLLDAGHAGEAVMLAARAMGCKARAMAMFADREMERAFRLPDDEWPMLAIEIEGGPGEAHAERALTWTEGEPNRLSPDVVEYPVIDEIHRATRLDEPGEEPQPEGWPGAWSEAIVRRRRSALDFEGGARAIRRDQYAALLECRKGMVDLYSFVHRVEGMPPGLYRGFELLRAGDQRVAAAGLSLGQSLAGNSCVTFSMLVDLEATALRYGERGYRLGHFDAGATGQRLYLASEAMGFQATGIGAFFDDRVHEIIGRQHVVYHFACGYAVRDQRLEG